jgi:prepilin-type N-terminal cleavage/methylation domain-containing protein
MKTKLNPYLISPYQEEKKANSAFTLVEIIVVMIILAIL